MTHTTSGPPVKALVFVSNVFLLALLSHENLHSLPIVVSSVFSPESTPLLIQQSPLLYLANLFICVFFFICLFILLYVCTVTKRAKVTQLHQSQQDEKHLTLSGAREWYEIVFVSH